MILDCSAFFCRLCVPHCWAPPTSFLHFIWKKKWNKTLATKRKSMKPHNEINKQMMPIRSVKWCWKINKSMRSLFCGGGGVSVEISLSLSLCFSPFVLHVAVISCHAFHGKIIFNPFCLPLMIAVCDWIFAYCVGVFLWYGNCMTRIQFIACFYINLILRSFGAESNG